MSPGKIRQKTVAAKADLIRGMLAGIAAALQGWLAAHPEVSAGEL